MQRMDASRLNRRRVLTMAGATAGSLYAMACGRGKQGATQASKSGQTAQARYGGQLNIPTTIDAFDYDPTHRPSENRMPIGMAYDGLLHTKATADVKYTDLVIEPWLAERWETPDAQNFTFHLRQGARFANLPPVNGRTLTPADAKWSIEYLANTGEFLGKKIAASLNAPMYTGLDSIETPDANTVVAHFKEPFIPFLSFIALEWNPMLAHEVYDQDGNFASHLVGTGPWQIDQAVSQKGTRWVYKKNPTYFQQGRPYIDQVNFLVLPDDATRYAAFRTKQADFAPGGDVGDLTDVQTAQQIQKDNPTAVVYQYLGTGAGHIYENVRTPPLNDPRVRKAIALCVDPDAFLKSFTGGQGEWALAGGYEGLFTQEEIKQMVKHDPAQARQLVSAAGYPNGVALDCSMGTDRGQQFINTLQLLQSQLKQGNINVNLKPMDRSTLGKHRQSHDFQLDYDLKTQDSDVDAYLFQTFYSTSAGNYGGINDPQLDQLLRQQRREVDAAKRKEILKQAVRRIADQAWSTALYYGRAYAFWQSYVKNFTPNYTHRAFPIVDTWLDK